MGQNLNHIPVPVAQADAPRALLLQLGMLGILILVALSPAAGLLNFVYTPLIGLAALALFIWRPMGYVAFVPWIWILTPMIRRMTDLVSGYNEVSLIMVAPLAATLVSVLGLLRPYRKLPSAIMLPYTAIIAVLIYGFLVGAMTAGLVAATFALLNWGAPVVFGLYLLLSQGDAPAKARALFDSMIWGLLFLGLYGLYQFFYLPAWDSYWMKMSDLRSIGAPIPQMIRVFSSLNSPAPLGFFLGAGLLIALSRPGRLTKVPLIPGAVTFLLSLVRSAWGGTVLGFLILLWKSDRGRKGWYTAGIVAAALAVIPIIAVSNIGEVIAKRTSSFGNLAEDDSLLARINIYSSFGDSAVSTVFGLGLGNTGDASTRLGNSQSDAARVIDSGLLETISNFGIVSIFMFVALATLLVRAWRMTDTHWPMATSLAVALSAGSQFALANPFFGPAGMCFYPFISLTILFSLDRPLSRRIPTDQLSSSPLAETRP